MWNMNLHIHSKYSDGIFSIQELVEAAIHYGITPIGFADHYLTMKTTSLDNNSLKFYLSEINKLKKRCYDVIEIYAGVEIDCTHSEFRPDEYNYELLNNLDFVLLEYVNDRVHDGISLYNLLPMLEKLKVPAGLAHNDIGKNFEGIDPKVLAEFLANNKIFVELDTSRRHRRFDAPYYRLARDFFRDYGHMIKLSIGSDLHTEIEEIANIGDAVSFVKSLKLEKSLLF
ncbi:MAG: PHP domain-containing protein [Thermoplasmata archaeon]